MIWSYLELGTWNLELGTWNLELGTWNLELGTWNLELRTMIRPINCIYNQFVLVFLNYGTKQGGRILCW